jgi:hypothetical protein
MTAPGLLPDRRSLAEKNWSLETVKSPPARGRAKPKRLAFKGAKETSKSIDTVGTRAIRALRIIDVSEVHHEMENIKQ